MTTIHPAAQPVVTALQHLADYRPASAADLANLLASVHNHDDSITTLLLEYLRTLALDATCTPGLIGTRGDLIAQNLTNAADQLGSLGDEHIDRARTLAEGGAR